MRIGVVTTSYPRWPGDAAGSFVEGHVTALRALGHDVEVIAAGDDAASVRDAPQVTRIPSRGLFYRGGAPDTLERAPLRSTVSAASFTARLAIAVARRAARWDQIIAHWLVPSAVAALPLRPPLTAIAHGGDLYTLQHTGLLAPVLRALRARDARVIVVAEHLRALARDRTLVVQPMGLDLAHFAALGRAPTTPPMILVVARLVPIKGVAVAIEAAKHLATPARIVIAGDGPQRAALENQARAAAPASIELVGQVDLARRDALLREASVVVVPSRVLKNGRTEGTPMIALEAAAAGVPVIASRVGGLAALAGVELVPPEEPVTLARAIDRILAAPPSSAALRATVADLGWDHVANRLLRND